MKFDSTLDCYQNIRRLQELVPVSPCVKWADLLPEEVETLRQLNATLIAIEQRYAAEAARLNPAFEARTARIEDVGHGRFHQVRLAEGDVRLSDFEVELQLGFWLKDTDPEYDAEDENMLWYIWVLLTYREPTAPNVGFGCVHVDHSDNGAPFPQCWLFHELDHWPLNRRDLLRIGSIWCDLVTTEQRLVPVNNSF